MTFLNTPCYRKPIAGFALVSLFALGLSSSATAALTPPDASTQLYRLENGLQVLTLHLPGVPMTGLNVQVKVGSAQEDFATSGMSHMLEHLLFNGSTDLTQKELYAATDRIGAYNNANTSRFYTNYMMLAPQASLEEAMYLQNQMLFHSLLPDEKFHKEKGIVLEEIAQGIDDPQHINEQLWNDFLLKGSSFELPTLGTAATIRGLERNQVYDFYKNWYRPNNMLLSVVGGFDPDTILDWIKTHYGAATPGPIAQSPLATLTWEPGLKSSRFGHVDEPLLRMAWPAPDQLSEMASAAGLLAWAAGDSRMGQIPALLFAQGLPPLPDMHFAWTGDQGAGRFECVVPLPMGLEADEAAEKIHAAMQNLAHFEFTQAALAPRVLQERSSWALLSEKPHYFGLMQADAFVQQGFEAVLHTPERLASVKGEDLNRVAALAFAQEPMTFVLYPESHEESTVMSQKTITRRAAEAGKAGVLINSASTSEVFALQVIVRGRSIWEGESRAGGIDLIHRLMKEGAAGQSAQDISARLKNIGAKLTLHDNAWIPYDDHYTSSSHSFLRIEVLRDYWPEALALAADMLLAPTLPQAAFERVRKQQKRGMDQEDLSPREISRNSLDASLYGDHPSRLLPSGTTESLDLLTRKDLLDLHRLAFRPENMIISIVGKVPVEACLEHIDALFSEATGAAATRDDLQILLQDNPYSEAFDLDTSPFVAPQISFSASTPEMILYDAYEGEQGALRLGSIFEADQDDKVALALLFSIISDKMAFDLREERGWAYSIGCWASSAGKGLVEAGAYMGVQASKQKESLKIMRSYLDGVKGVTQEDLDNLRGGITGRRLMRRLASINQAWGRALGELAGDIDAQKKRDAALAAVTLGDLLRVQKRYLKNIPWTLVEVN
jgi:zinc protease